MATLEITASSAKTVTGQSSPIPTAGRDKMAVMIDCTAVSGTTPNMALSIEWSRDANTWMAAETPDTLTAMTAAGKKSKDFAVKADYMRLVWTITGTTPSFTFAAHLWLSN